MYKRILIGLLVLVIGVPSVSLAGSFTLSLIQGKTPSEALVVISEQIDFVTGRISQLEEQQENITRTVEETKEQVNLLQDQLEEEPEVVPPSEPTPECLALKVQLEQLKEPVRALEEQIQTLERRYRDEEPGSVSCSSNDISEEIECQQKAIEEAQTRKQEHEKTIEKMEEELEGLLQEYNNASEPLTQSANDIGCLLG